MERRTFLGFSAAATLLAAMPVRGQSPDLVVTKDATCGCCGAWVEHMRAAGFDVEVRDTDAVSLNALKARLGVRPEHASCHTAEIGGYWIEGHVPAEDVARLLDERPKAAGLAVPGMPVGSPGLEMGDAREPFDTLLVGRDGGAQVFAAHR